MPVYEYKCNACGKEFEYQQRMSDPEKTDCEACGKSALERLISRTAFQLKGSGWYKDLYSSSKPAESKPSGSETGGSASSGDSSAASAPASAGSASTPSSTGGTGGTGSGGGTGS